MSSARAFSLAGVLAIVRFRTVMEDTRDTVFVVFAVVMGMSAGAGYPDELRERPSDTPVRCVVTDLHVGSNWPLGRFGVARVLEELPARGYREAWTCGSLSVYAFDGAGCLKCVPTCR